MAGGGGNAEEGNVNIIPLLDVIFIFIFFLLMSVQFLEYFQITASNPVQKTPPNEPPPPDQEKPKQFKLRLSQDKIEFTEGMEEKILGTFSYNDADLSNLKKVLHDKKMEFPKENSMIIKPYKNVEFDKIVQAIDCAHQKMDPKKKNSEKAFRSIAFESRTDK